MSNASDKESPLVLSRLLRYGWILASIWTVVISLILADEVISLRQFTHELARAEAYVHYNWMVSFRSWVATHSGVYAPITEDNQPNEYLNLPERDITTPSGKKLTLINPAYMSRQVFSTYGPTLHIKGRLTSLKPINPANAPDQWERAALEGFEKGSEEQMDYRSIDGKPFLRMMRPLFVGKSCLTCHASQGYKEGDIRGGISISVPLEEQYRALNQDMLLHTARYTIIWIAGLFLISFGIRRIASQVIEREKAQEQSKLLFTAIEHAAEVVIITDVEGTIRYANSAVEKTSGYRREELIGNNPRIFKSGRQSDLVYKEMWNVLTEGKVWQGRLSNKRKDGSIFSEDTTISPVVDSTGKVSGYVGIKHDVTGEAMLAKAREFFAAAASHELRTPLTKLQLFKMFFDEIIAGENDPERLKQYGAVLDEVYTDIYRVVSATTTLTGLANLGKEEVGKVMLKQYIGRTLSLLVSELANSDREITVTSDFDPIPDTIFIPGDEVMLDNIFGEVLSNATKYTPDGKNISIRVYVEDGMAVIEVADQGIGLLTQEVEQLFEPFFSLENVAEHSTGRYRFRGGGMGLGLTLARLMSDFLGGSISIDSKGLDLGSTVIMKLPIVEQG